MNVEDNSGKKKAMDRTSHTERYIGVIIIVKGRIKRENNERKTETVVYETNYVGCKNTMLL